MQGLCVRESVSVCVCVCKDTFFQEVYGGSVSGQGHGNQRTLEVEMN